MAEFTLPANSLVTKGTHYPPLPGRRTRAGWKFTGGSRTPAQTRELIPMTSTWTLVVR